MKWLLNLFRKKKKEYDCTKCLHFQCGNWMGKMSCSCCHNGDEFLEK